VLTYVLDSIDVAVPKGFEGKAAVIVKETLPKVVVLPMLFLIICDSPRYKGCDFFCRFTSNNRTISLFRLVELGYYFRLDFDLTDSAWVNV
jgi:hypothetical protein